MHELVVATQNNQVPHLDMLSTRSLHPALRSLIPAYFLSGNEARAMEPALSSRVIGAVLMEAGAVDVQALEESLVDEVEENHGAVLDATVSSVERVGNEWEVRFEMDGQEEALRAGRVVDLRPNATGMSSLIMLM
jgi:L-2-hydroxyglutarate oxidase LhgO